MAIPQLTLGSFNLTDWSGSTYGTSVIAQGTSKGAPVPLEVAVKSWLQNGSIVVTQGYDNRTVNLRVKFRAPSLTAVAAAEAAFFAQIGIPNTLTWTPASGPASVFVVVTSSMEEAPSDDNDLAENQAFPWRTYNVRLLCEAFVRSVAETSAVALPTSGSTTTVLDAMGATTGWTGTVNGASGTVVNAAGPPTTNALSSAAGSGTFTIAMQKTFAATTTSTKLLVVDWKSSHPGATSGITAVGDGTTLGLVAEQASPTAGFTRTYFYVAAASLAVTQFQIVAGTFVNGTVVVTLTLDNVSVTNIPPSSGSLRQQLRSWTISGSAPTPGKLKIESPTAALGNGVLIYTYPPAGANGYTPSMRQFRTAGSTVTSDATMVSGSREPANAGGIGFTIPNYLLPAGLYTLMVRMGLSSGVETGSIAVTVTSSLGTVQSTYTYPLSLSTTYTTSAVMRLTLPNVDVPSVTTGSTLFIISATGFVANANLDEAWLFNTSIGQLIQVDCGVGAGSSGGAARRLFIEPPNPSSPRPTLRMGHAADGSDSYYPTIPNGFVRAWQQPKFATPQTNVFFVTPGATDAVATLSASWRWHTNAAS